MIVFRFLVAALLLFIIVTVVAFVYLQWWQALLVVLATVIAIAIGLKMILRTFIGNIGKAMMAGFELKGRVLRGATAQVHSVQAAPVPPPRVIDEDPHDADEEVDDEEEDGGDSDDEPPRELAYYQIDVTIRPADAQGPMTHWDVTDLCVVDHQAAPLSLTFDEQSDPGEGFHFHDVQVMQDGQLREDEQGKYEGEQRLNVLVGVRPEMRELKFRYYTEQFGRIVLPPPYPRDVGAQPQLS